NSSGSDSYSFWRVGYPSIFFFENVFSPFYHSTSDLLANANMDYCAEVMRASMSLLLHSQIVPSPVSGFQVVDMGNGSSILLKWNPSTENDIAGYKIFQGTTSGNYSKSYFTTAPTFTIDGLVEGTTYFFGIAAVDQLGNESDIQEKTVIPRLLPLAPKNLTSDPKIGMIELRWNKNSDYDLAGYNLYRANSPGGVGVKLNSSILTDTLFVDNTPQKGTYYYYSVRAVDNTLLESSSSNEVRSRVVSLDQGICIFDATKDGDGSPGNPTDQEVDDFYLSLVPNYNVKVYDTKTLGTAKLSDLGAFSTIIWHTNISSDLNELNLSSEELKKYLDFGGKLLLTTYLPSKAILMNSSYPKTFTPGQMIYDKLKIKNVDYAIFSRFSGASPLLSGYPNIFVDTTKTLASNGYHLTWIESIDAAPGAANIFSYETNYDSTTTSGKMKGKPVGIEYLGADFKVVTLSFPLYFMKFNEVKTLVNYILSNKFNELTSVDDLSTALPKEFALYQNYPNPFNPMTTITFSVPSDKNVTLSLFNTLGQKVRTLFEGEAKAGKNVIEFNADGLPSGVYYYQIKAGSFFATKKMLLIK
ncbi:MAG: T9SS type A sorting domain-containing protein, partial [Bacteroidetes bacterium]|nr:T9SS type A sorting domain-containing protein [Bacteroidota bacterium]